MSSNPITSRFEVFDLFFKRMNGMVRRVDFIFSCPTVMSKER